MIPPDPIIVAPSPTPFRPDDSVDYAAIERNVQRWLQTPLSGFVLNSENGEEAFLSEQERREIVHAVSQAGRGQKLLIAGVDHPSVLETLRLGEALVEAGAELLRIRIPRLTSNVAGYFRQVVPRAAAPVVVIHQMAPGRFLSAPAAIGAPAELIGDIVAMENVFGYIMSDNLRFEARVRTRVASEKRFWGCNGGLLFPAACLGANGACLMLGNVAPQQCGDIIRLVMEGHYPQAQAIHTRILELDWTILSRGAAGVKAALDVLGYDGGPPRSPATGCDDDAKADIRNALHHAGLIR